MTLQRAKILLSLLLTFSAQAQMELLPPPMPLTNTAPQSAIRNPQSTILTWSPSISPNIIGYNLYQGTTSHSYTNEFSVGAVTNLVITNTVTGTVYYFAVAAVNASGLQSALSPEASYERTNYQYQTWIVLSQSPDDIHWTNTPICQATNNGPGASRFYRLGWQTRKVPTP
jgi:Fibronectin type III domain